MADPVWTPTARQIADARITDFAAWLCRHQRADISVTTDYAALWRWSVEDVEQFWMAIWDYFDVGDRGTGPALAGDRMPEVHWFPEIELNYVEYLFRHSDPDRPAVVEVDEDTDTPRTLTFGELRTRVAALAQTLRNLGVDRGDRVVGYLPNTAETVTAFLATASLGAVWAACGQDYAPVGAAHRFAQLEPRVLVAATGYHYGGRHHDKRQAVEELRRLLPSVQRTLLVDRDTGLPDDPHYLSWSEATADASALLSTEPVPFDHPLWVVFSSGTTGQPKGLVHGHGGVLLEHLKALALHFDLAHTDRLFWYTTPSWMMWNFQLSALLLGASIVCYAGSPTHRHVDTIWRITAQTSTTVLGTSPGYVLACEKGACTPRDAHDLTMLRTVGVTGAPFPAASAHWIATHVGADIPAVSITGGTDVVTAFLGGAPTVATWPGQLSCPWLGVAVDAFDDTGAPVRDAVGELVVTAPLPSMPVVLWNDPDQRKYREAYFDTYPGVWRHGDWVTITTARGITVHGRSDATLNRNGIRIGSADIYDIVENLPEITEALVIGVERPDGSYWMPMFVVPAPGQMIDDEMKNRICHRLRSEASNRHVPDDIITAPGIPHTRTGKKLEVPIKRILLGHKPTDVADPATVDQFELLDWYAHHATSSTTT
ncbi:acetoacetate--CoA ligase [Rhodococcus sp. 14C212]|uniref:acetoacetate--CoA ligase n=1 Tax=Rhodococcus sp. 14C212 TaxID=2711209 RepID=UPI0013EBA25F|nr:acetoacetate--CoA ligase [Rhodococcus sp. 14C212]NGP07741.1 acetoacetate--CoA ligase [Rhodococcus sp. 14C212]